MESQKVVASQMSRILDAGKKKLNATTPSIIELLQQSKAPAVQHKASTPSCKDMHATSFIRNHRVIEPTAQLAKVGERKLGMTDVPPNYNAQQTNIHGLLATKDKGLFHQHIFFEDDGQPGDIGFHDNELFHEPHMEGAYNWSIQNLNDSVMRMAVKLVGAPGTYHLFTNNCQAYVTKVLNEYKWIARAPADLSKEDVQSRSEMGYSLFVGQDDIDLCTPLL